MILFWMLIVNIVLLMLAEAIVWLAARTVRILVTFRHGRK